MGKKGFVISMDLLMAIGVVLVMILMLTSFSPYEWGIYSYVSDAVTIIEHRGVSSNPALMQAELEAILPYDSYNFTLIDFGPMSPLSFCKYDSDCNATYSKCIFYICGDYSMNIKTGEYQEYSADPSRYCSPAMIADGSCKPEGDLSQRIYVETGSDDLVDNFYIIRLEVAE